MNRYYRSKGLTEAIMSNFDDPDPEVIINKDDFSNHFVEPIKRLLEETKEAVQFDNAS